MWDGESGASGMEFTEEGYGVFVFLFRVGDGGGGLGVVVGGLGGGGRGHHSVETGTFFGLDCHGFIICDGNIECMLLLVVYRHSLVLEC